MQSIGGRPAIDSPQSMLIFQSTTLLVGDGGCNTFSGAIGIEGGRMLIGPLASTRRACDDAIMAQEAALLSALESVRSFQANEQVLLLFGPAGTQTVALSRTPALLWARGRAQG
ncbi:MAG: META domain-containing protein [Rhodospirillales bacterium]|nr:META domain-containing protein [Rhodospirillales bacterium]